MVIPFNNCAKEKSQIAICVDYQKLNAQTKEDPFLSWIQWLDMKCIHLWTITSAISKLKWQKKTKKIQLLFQNGLHIHITLCHLGYVMFLPLSKNVTKTFKEYLNKFMQVFLDNFSVYGSKKDHLGQLQKCLEECRQSGINLNPEKNVHFVLIRVLYLDILFIVMDY